MRKAILIATAAALVAMAPQLASATPASNGAAILSGTTVAEPATFYRRDYDYYPRHRYYGHSYYPRHRNYRYYDYDSYYPRRHYYQRDYLSALLPAVLPALLVLVVSLDVRS